MTLRAVFLGCLVLLVGSSSGAQPVRDERAEAVIEAALRQQVSFWLSEDARAIGTVVCLAVEQAGVAHSVSKDYLEQFHERSLRRSAECEARPEGAVERATGVPAVILTGGPVEWRGPDEAFVTVRAYRSRLFSASQQFRVVKEAARWICLGQVVRMTLP